MVFDSLKEMKKEEFCGFVSVGELQEYNCEQVPKTPGVYFILHESNAPRFRKESIGGHFKGKNPTVDQKELFQNWVEDSKIVYIGKAGSPTGSATLQSRLRQYMKFGQGKPIGHWGGRYIWQLENSSELIVTWKPTNGVDPREIEKSQISSHKSTHGKRPFANLTG